MEKRKSDIQRLFDSKELTKDEVISLKEEYNDDDEVMLLLWDAEIKTW